MRHATDGSLVRWLDGECDAVERTALARHLGGCASCRGRLDAMRDRSDLLRHALRRHVPRRRRPPLRTASVAAAALVLLVAVPPVRAWVVEHASAIWATMIGARARPSPHRVPGAVTGGGSVSFVPAGDSFFVQVRGRQRSGELTVEFADAGVASARLSGEAAGAEFVVLPGGLRIMNTAQSRASYALRLPSALTVVVLRVADEPAVYLRPRSTGRWDMDLAAREKP